LTPGCHPCVPIAAPGPPPAVACRRLQGKIFIHLKGLPTSDEKIFCGKKRYTWGFAQGRFKSPVM
jgi:hypothetical protein